MPLPWKDIKARALAFSKQWKEATDEFADDTGIFEKNNFFDYINNSKEDGSDLSARIARLSELLDTPQEERRALGAHYTNEENIMKVIKPLFLDELWEEFERIKGNSKQLQYFHEKLSKLTFLDPACGCGNFLIIAYKELRLLELEVLKLLIDTGGQQVMDIAEYCKISVDQFYGIECEEFPCQIAVVGMWLIDHQMNMLVSEHFGLYFARLPLEHSATIVHGNALKIDWENVVPKNQLNYILGNPPFAGARLMSKEQKSDLLENFSFAKGIGNLDYVSAWYLKAAHLIGETNIQVAFVSTNSITQGEQVPILWEHLMSCYNIEILFGYRTFSWANEARGKASVHCVITGFSFNKSETPPKSKYIIDEGGHKVAANNINPYLVDAPNVFIHSRTKPLCNVPTIRIGNKPIDGGYYLFTEAEKDEFLLKEPLSKNLFRPWIGSKEFINGYKRYCLWLGDSSPTELQKLPEVMKRIEAVRNYRLSSNSIQTIKIADKPRSFHVKNIPTNNYIVIPKVSSEKRNYVPIGYIDKDIMASDLLFILSDATLYHFGVLTSKVHMAWMRAVCGRLESRYRYSKDIVYNNFPWPEPTEQQQAAIEAAAQQVLDARALFPKSSLADLYDPLTMPPALTKAHNNLDRAVVAAYGGPGFATEAERVADLMKRYQKLSAQWLAK